MLSRYRLVDRATQGYLLFVAVVALALRGDGWLTLVATHLAAMAAVHWLISREAGGTTTAASRWLLRLREFYPVLLYAGLYTETVTINRMLQTPRLDPWLLRADHLLFSCQPAEVFPARLAQPWFSELMHLSYLSYYVMVGGLAAWLLLRDIPAFRHFVTVVSLVFYACYTTYLFVPAVGPRVLWADTPERATFVALYGHAPRPTAEPAESEVFRRGFAFIEANGEIPGAAFPSSHVVVAFVTAWFSWRYVPRIRWAHLLLAVSILFSTIYTRAHYAVDVVGGLVALALLLPAAQALHRRCEGRAQTARS